MNPTLESEIRRLYSFASARAEMFEVEGSDELAVEMWGIAYDLRRALERTGHEVQAYQRVESKPLPTFAQLNGIGDGPVWHPDERGH